MTLIISRDDVERLLAAEGAALYESLIQHVQAGYEQLAAERVLQHRRVYLRLPDAEKRRPPGLFSMSALLPDSGIMGTRLLALAGRAGQGQGLLVLFDYRQARCLAILDDSTLHNYRTGAPSAVATRRLARPESRVVACIGSGRLATGGLAMICHTLPQVETVRVYSRSAEHRTAFARHMAQTLGLDVQAVDSSEAATVEADVILTATDADRPVVSDAAVQPGTHINILARNEVEMATFRRGKVVTSVTALLQEHDPPWHEPLPESWVHAELGAVLTGRAAGRESADEITIFIGSAPLAMWDVAAAAAFYEAARRLGCGTEVDIGSFGVPPRAGDGAARA
ncbi:MAG TPA: hypothetical protein VK066_24870 [Chloroflexota bacterium]|nr:hypothetical protein [Chloroflexota bacterium]